MKAEARTASPIAPSVGKGISYFTIAALTTPFVSLLIGLIQTADRNSRYHPSSYPNMSWGPQIDTSDFILPFAIFVGCLLTVIFSWIAHWRAESAQKISLITGIPSGILLTAVVCPIPLLLLLRVLDSFA
ncbi:MAG: hypothetical protein WCL04_03170 [Verrucomicrobiota bacterium]